ncbi:MAG: NAD(P)/FAD-dependent oxidoreductase [Bryobacter sp.]
MASNLHRVVIIGGGFAGVRAAQALAKEPVQITLLDKRNYHLFQPLLYQVATGGLSPGEIAAPLRAIFARQKNVEVLLEHVLNFDLAAREVHTSSGTVPYDTLIVAAGAKSTYYGKDQWRAHAPSLKSIEDATLLRARIFEAFEEAEKTKDPAQRRAWLTFLIVGGGATGVELAGALGEIANDTLRHDFRSIRPEEARIMILDAGSRILSNFSPALSQSAERQLIELGVRFRNNVRVKDISPEGATVLTHEGESFFPARTVLWAAGVTGSPLAEALSKAANVPLARGGRIAVEPDCTVPGHPEVFVLGDLAYFDHSAQGESPNGKASSAALPGVCQVAMQMGDYTGALIAARLRGKTKPAFRYFDRGNMAVIGRHRAIAQVGPYGFSGYFAWLLWVFIHVIYLVSFESRVIVAFRWAFSYFTFNRGARLITRPALSRPPLLPGA